MSADEGAPETPLLEVVYDRLRAIARHRLSQESPAHTLQATALVNEAWLKLQHRESVMQLDHSRFLLAAAEAMRRILIDHARARGCAKRGGGRKATMDLADVAALAQGDDADQILELDAAIQKLKAHDAQAAAVVELRFFTGLSVEETADCLELSPRTVKRDWQFARAWLFRAMSE
jgi:RNA polymerase sigma factor (TIGR02999 family)